MRNQPTFTPEFERSVTQELLGDISLEIAFKDALGPSFLI
jgi:hypothetical protein